MIYPWLAIIFSINNRVEPFTRQDFFKAKSKDIPIIHLLRMSKDIPNYLEMDKHTNIKL